MELNIYKNKKISIFWGIIEFSNIYFLIKLFIGLLKTIKTNFNMGNLNIPFLWKLFSIIEILLILSIIISGCLYFFNKRSAYYIYYGQVILRILFALPSFGLLLKINYFFKNEILYKILFIICIILEILRLITTIFITIKSKKDIFRKC